MGSLECRPGRINNECAKAKRHQQRLRPPDIGAHRFPKGTSRQLGGNSGHDLRIMTRPGTQATEHRLSGDALKLPEAPMTLLLTPVFRPVISCYRGTQAVLTACLNDKKPLKTAPATSCGGGTGLKAGVNKKESWGVIRVRHDGRPLRNTGSQPVRLADMLSADRD